MAVRNALAKAQGVREATQVRVRNQTKHLQVQLADAKGSLARANTEIAKLPFLIEATQASVE